MNKTNSIIICSYNIYKIIKYISLKKNIDDNSQCAICMDDFNLDEQAKKLPCKHLFHNPCIAQWLKLVIIQKSAISILIGRLLNSYINFKQS